MTDIDLLKREIKVLSFDQYGTIVDMQGSLVESATPYLKKKGWAGNPTASSPGGGAHISRTR